MKVYMVYEVQSNKQKTLSTRLFKDRDKAKKEVNKLNNNIVLKKDKRGNYINHWIVTTEPILIE